MGQIYIPAINWFLMIMCIVVVATFRSTTDIANAYGIYVSFFFSSLLFSFRIRLILILFIMCCNNIYAYISR